MELGSIMSTQLAELQQTVQMSVMKSALNMGAVAAIDLLEQMPQPQAAQHPYKGTVIDVTV